MNRGRAPTVASWELNTTFLPKEVAALEPGEHIGKWCGMVAGYAAGISVDRCKDKDTLGVVFFIVMPRPLNMSPLTTELEGGLPAGVSLTVDFTVYFTDFSPFPAWEQRKRASMLVGCKPRSWEDVFGKPWAETVRGARHQFSDGTLEVKAEVKLAVKG